MRVLHLSVYDNVGGAGKAAFRLNSILSSFIDSKMLVLHKTSNNDSVVSFTLFFEKVYIKILFLIEKFFILIFGKNKNINFSIIHLNFFGVINKIKLLKPDIIHVHWIGNGMISLSELEVLKIPLVWTMHDHFIITGGCYTTDCKLYKVGCNSCPYISSINNINNTRVEFISKQNLLNNLFNFTLLTPSNYFYKLSNESSVTSSVSKFLIPNVIDDDIFYPVLKKEARDFFNLNMDTIYVGFGSMNFSIDKNKGFHLFLDSIKYLKYDITFLFFGTEINLSDLCESINYINVGYINDDKSLNFLYNSMDILVVPSLFENLSCTIMESLSSSTPVVAFDTGGNSDLIIHQYNGYLAQPFESLDLANGINWILEVEDFNKLKSNSREHILKNFSKETVLDSHLKLYNKILSC